MLVANRSQQQNMPHLSLHRHQNGLPQNNLRGETGIFECAVCARQSTPGASLEPVRAHVRMLMMRGDGAKDGGGGEENNKNNNSTGGYSGGCHQQKSQSHNQTIVLFQSSTSNSSSSMNMMKHFVLLSPEHHSVGGQRSSSCCCCCADCFELFRSVVITHRDCRIQPQISCITGIGACPITSPKSNQNWVGNESAEQQQQQKYKNCLSCWLDRCALAGLRADAIAFLGVKFVSNKAKTRVGRFDKTLEKRLSILMNRSQPIVKRFEPDEAMLDFALINSLLYVNNVCRRAHNPSVGCCGLCRVRLSLLDGRTTIDLLVERRHPLLFGSKDNIQRMLMRPEEHFYSGVLPTSVTYHSLHFPDAVTVHVEHSDPFFVRNFFDYMDEFLSLEYSHSMPIFQLLDTHDMTLQLTSTASLCNAFGNATYSAQLQAPMLIFPGGFIPSVAVFNFLGKVRWAIANGGEYPARGYRGGKNTVAVKFLNNVDLIDEMERCARSYSVDFAEVFRRVNLTDTEIALLRAMIITSPKTPGLSTKARILLDVEWKKHLKLLRSHLQRELGSADAAERRVELLRGLINNELNDMNSEEFRYVELLRTQLKVPLHFPPPSSPVPKSLCSSSKNYDNDSSTTLSDVVPPVIADANTLSIDEVEEEDHNNSQDDAVVQETDNEHVVNTKRSFSCSSEAAEERHQRNRKRYVGGLKGEEEEDNNDNAGLHPAPYRLVTLDASGFRRRLPPPFIVDTDLAGRRINRLGHRRLRCGPGDGGPSGGSEERKN